MTEVDDDNKKLFAQQWACLTCSTTFPLGKVIVGDRLRCPNCRSADLFTATGEVVDVPEYLGEIGTKN